MATYTRDEIEQLVDIPASVEYELKETLDGNLRRCGIFSRVYSRIKSAASLEHKFTKPEYQAGKKVQDIIGVRITLYFEDDIEVCKNIIRKWFRPVDEWEEYNNNISEFRASKINGIFELNGDWIRRIKDTTWDLPIDQTFEIQIRTTFFEGWHEVEHDMRYKNKDIWEQYPVFSRKLNSVVATLELCDSSMVSICEDFAHKLYLDKEWDAMIRMHYRLRMNDDPIDPELKKILDENNKTLGKRLYRCRREALIDALFNEKRIEDAVSINQIIMLVNEKDADMHDPEIARIAAEHLRFRKGNNNNRSLRNYQYTINPLEEYNNFRNKLTISCEGKDRIALFNQISMTIYSWTRDKYKAIFTLPAEYITNFDANRPGFWLHIDYDQNNLEFTLQTYHLSTSEAGQLWSVHAHLKYDREKNQYDFITKSSIMSTVPISLESRIVNYNPPRFYSEIVKNEEYQASDIKPLSKKCIPIDDSDSKLALEVINMIMEENRETPVILVVSKKGEDGYLDEVSWLSRYWCSDLAERTGQYAHIYRCGKVVLRKILAALSIDNECCPAVYMFNTKCMETNGRINKTRYKCYTEDYVKECVHSSVRVFSERANVQTKIGERAFLQELVDSIRIDNISK